MINSILKQSILSSLLCCSYLYAQKAEEMPQFAWALLWFAEVLKNNGRGGEASSFEKQAATVSAAIQAKAKR